ncbi:hypothetical protein VC83_08369 [Pseudogymnoascus destructans]|uniref:Uncharacterized protein n=1 Tax=Pseudogymnoascus destructans TaxID=655981 RepID=A0A177A1K9_9PEZI|nr:uncharacterized protein VC83_08369 [Pseudogymnoascus destructans]OAF55470.1 hypothetical protein VC83_08369 [Pseudogymnoascus destructans]
MANKSLSSTLAERTWTFQKTLETDAGPVSVRARMGKRKWPDIVEVDKPAQDIRAVKKQMTRPVVPDNQGKSHVAALDDENSNFIAAGPKKPKDQRKNLHKPAPSQAEKELIFPAIDPSIIPENERLDVLEVLQLGNKFMRAPPKQKGVVHGVTAGYLRHQAAPYAYSYRGKLKAAYWPYRKACNKDGQQILSDARIRQLCSGRVYQRAQKEYLESRDAASGKFTVRKTTDAPVLNQFSQVQGLAAAILDERNEFALKKLTGKEIGTMKLSAARKNVVAREAQALEEQARGMRAQQQVTALVRKNLKREVAHATERKDQRIEELESSLQEVVHHAQQEISDEVIKREAAMTELAEENALLRLMLGMGE